jgi:hypothetical protein
MSTDPADDDRNAEVIPPLTAAARSADTCISCGSAELVTEDLCEVCLPWHPVVWPEDAPAGWPHVDAEPDFSEVIASNAADPAAFLARLRDERR